MNDKPEGVSYIINIIILPALYLHDIGLEFSGNQESDEPEKTSTCPQTAFPNKFEKALSAKNESQRSKARITFD